MYGLRPTLLERTQTVIRSTKLLAAAFARAAWGEGPGPAGPIYFSFSWGGGSTHRAQRRTVFRFTGVCFWGAYVLRFCTLYKVLHFGRSHSVSRVFARLWARVVGRGATASQARPFQRVHVLVHKAFTVSVYMFLRHFCTRHWQSTSELVGVRKQVGAESVRSMCTQCLVK